MADKDPIVTHVFTADPSAHVFNNKLYIYPSHDRESNVGNNDNGDQYDMADYHVFSMDSVGGPVTDHGVVLKQEDIPWVDKQLWAPDAATKNGKYYLYFPARDREGIFRVGVAVGDKPEGPFTPEPEPIKGSFSIDPATFVDDDGEAYLYFGGIWGGQLQCWTTGSFDRAAYSSMEATSGPALCAKVGRLTPDMKEFASDITDVVILDEAGEPLQSSDHERRFFEAAWLHKYNGTYYFSYSTGDTHLLCYATASSPLGPFTYRGRILEPVIGWTTHHSIAEFGGKWWLFYHDSSLSKGVNHLRCVKIREIVYNDQGEIRLAEEQPKVEG
jgi:hypothetical protein